MPSSSKSVVDERGYVFCLPTLGMPDPAGEWVSIKVAMGTKEKAISLLNEGGYDAPRRFACNRYKIVAVDYESAVWILPFCAPEKKAKDTETFTLKVRRLPPADIPGASRLKVPDGLGMWSAFHPGGLNALQLTKEELRAKNSKASKPPTEADEKAFWSTDCASLTQDKDKPKTLSPSLFSIKWAKLSTSAHPLGWPSNKSKKDAPRSTGWQHSPAEAFEDAWCTEAMAQAFIEAVQSSTPVSFVGPGIELQAHAETGSNDVIVFEYAFSFGEEAPPSRKDQWKRVPTRAWKPGYELKFVNQVRESYGKKPIKENQLHLTRPASSS